MTQPPLEETRLPEQEGRVISQTQSVCPSCLATVPAEVVRCGSEVFLIKRCVDHGRFATVVWRGLPPIETWTRPKVPLSPPSYFHAATRGCPLDCGLCVEHRQQTCTALFEVTSRCNLHCPVCFASSSTSGPFQDPALDSVVDGYRRLMDTRGPCNIQLSGGEPTVREDLPELIEAGRRIGFEFLQVNTNGLRIARDGEYARILKEAGLSSVFLQFDGTDEEIHRVLRGRPLLEEKKRAIDRCGESGLGVVLVPTVAPSVNAHDLGNIVAFAEKRMPVVRGVHFQPVSYFGRYSGEPSNADRITLPEVMTGLEQQTSGRMRARDFRPPGCEHALCSFHGTFVGMPGGNLIPLNGGQQTSCCSEPEKAEEGSRRTVAVVAQRWSHPAAPEGCGCRSRQVSEGSRPKDDLDRFLERARTHTLSVSAMAFQDAWTLDLERLRGCCIHVAAPGGRLIPFCAYNLTSLEGRSLYRGKAGT